MKKQYFKIIVTLLIFLIAGICDSCNRSPMDRLPSKEEIVPEVQLPEDPVNEIQQSETFYEYVYICGEVHTPGVYQVEQGTRIFEVIELAGGFTDQADPTQLNLAQAVGDGMKIVVLSIEEAERLKLAGGGSTVMPQQGDKVNLNEATKEQLMTLKGIGESRAEDIIQYRETHGPFKKIEDIMQVSGIKDSAFQKIKDHVTV